MGVLRDFLTDPKSPIFGPDGSLIPEIKRNPDILKNLIIQKQGMDAEWMQMPSGQKRTILQAAGVDTKVMDVAARRKAELDRQAKDVDSWKDTIGRRVLGGVISPIVEGMKGAESGKQYATEPGGYSFRGPGGAIMNAPYNAARGTVGAAAEERAKGQGQDKESARAQGDVAERTVDVAAPLALGVGAARSFAKGAPPAVAAAEPELALAEDPETGEILEKNAPPSPQNQEKLEVGLKAQGIDTSNPKEVFDKTVEGQTGKPMDSNVTVGQVPISSSDAGTSASPNVDLAEGTPAEAVHEGQHKVSDITGAPQPPEDNDAIVEAELARFRDLRNPNALRVGQEEPPLDTSATAARMGNKQPERGPVKVADPRAAWNNTPGVPGEEDVTPIEPNAEKPQGATPYDQYRSAPPREKTAQAGEDPNAMPSSATIGNEKKWKQGSTPGDSSVGDTQVRGPFVTAADKFTRALQATTAFKSPPHIILSNQVRLFGAAAKMALSGDVSEAGDLLGRMYTSAGREQTSALMAKLIASDPESIGEYLSGGVVSKGESPITDTLGAPNFWAHGLAKRAMLVSRLKYNMQRLGLELNPGNISNIPKEALGDAMAFGNKYAMTYSPNPYDKASGLESSLGHALAATRGPIAGPLSRLAILYGRYTANGIIAMSEDNPLLILRALGKDAIPPAGTLNITHGRQLASGLTGLAAMYAGYKMAEKSPQLGVVNFGDTDVNMIHQVPGYGPLLALGAAAHNLTHLPRGRESVVVGQTFDDLAQSVLGFPGIALTVVKDIVKEGGVGGAVGRTVAGVGGALTTPLRVLTDLFGLIDKEQMIRRDTSGSMLAPAIANTPFLNKTLPPQRSPERAGDLYNTPTYMLGVRGQQAQTPVQNEMNRLGMYHPAWYPYKSNVPDSADKNLKYRTAVGQDFETRARQAMADPAWNTMPDPLKRERLEKEMHAAQKGGRLSSGATPQENLAPEKAALYESLAVK